MKNADLHTHTFYSADSDISPEDLVKKAKKVGLKYVAITDHDCIGGIERALKAGRKSGIEVIPGVEMHSEFGEVLGLFIDYNNKRLVEACRRNKKAVDKRALKIINSLRKAGLCISIDEIRKRNRIRIVERPHIANELVRKGYAKSFRDAFDRFIAEGKKHFFKARFPTTFEAVRMIKQAKGIPVLAHPYQENYREEFRNIKKLVDAGLGGIEFPSKADLPQKRRLRNLAKKYNLVLTCGSDFHGSVHPHILLGDYNCNESVVLALKKQQKFYCFALK